MKKFHAAVNHVSETSSNILVRLKELGQAAPSLRLPKKMFGNAIPCQHEGFVLETEGLAQLNGYLIPTGACKVISREYEAADNAVVTPFDVDAYMASMDEADPFA